MTTTDIILRINDAIRNGDQDDLYNLHAHVTYVADEGREVEALLALIETAGKAIDGSL